MELTPYCNTGVATPTFTVRLDYLTAHVEADLVEVIERLAKYLGCQRSTSRGMLGYSHGVDFGIGDDVWFRGFYSIGSRLLVQAPGEWAQPVWDCLKASDYAFRVTRMDAALDVYDAEWFPIAVDVMTRYANQRNPPLATSPAGDWNNPVRGRTFYLGTRQSKRYLRAYEKGRQMRTDPNHVRLEVEYHPQTDVERDAASGLTAAQCWLMYGYDVWGAMLGLDPKELFNLPVVENDPRRRRDQERAWNALCLQYGKHLEKRLQQHGGDAQAFVTDLMTNIEHQRRVQQWTKPTHLELPESPL